MYIYIRLSLNDDKYDKIRSYLLYNQHKINDLNLELEIEYIDLSSFQNFENIQNTPYLYCKEDNITIKKYNDIIKYLYDLI